ncbi:thiamine-monophosphate kinase [Trichodesmium erythraeum IMS101]|uniref:Thiamine-monophosphate kinase n=1 Tax=Trichodesmium erythraeum (strain IMS101) TaxID=203124 RepID=Q10XH5_TRIEI|nr:thiamine-phosphate kinase [Trichodesmium erythraeum GBRTRLIN201]
MLKVKDISEQELLKKLRHFCPENIIGDDAAILPTQPNKSLVVTTDTLVDGVHFSDRTTSPEDVGWRSAAANLSDIAAMGAFPIGITIALGLTVDTPIAWCEQLYQGISECLQPYNTPIVGGDIVRSPVSTISITAFGQIDGGYTILRSNCQPKNVIVATGVHGASRAGLELLLYPELGESLTELERSDLILAHQRPKPRLDILDTLWDCLSLNSFSATKGSKNSILVGGMDSSDGLADAIIQICQASQIGARIERNQIPIPHSLTKFVSDEQALNWALYGGEDFELVLCLPPNCGQELVKRIGVGAAIVGTTTNNTDILLIDSQGIYPNEQLTLSQGFQHF